MSISENLQRVYTEITQLAQQKTGQAPRVFHDSDWPSPCEIPNSVENDSVAWQQVAQNGNMQALEKALETQFPAALQAYFGSFYSDNLFASYQEHNLCLLQAWSEQDFDRLQQNITGHVLMKRRLKQTDTVFFATCEEDDLLLVMKLEDASIWLEYLGKEPHHKLADSMEAFLADCSGLYYAQ
ncbi:SecY-interacting protein [Pseudoalteromonas spongiae]|uniref:SecY-interacting protein n=1 Tax=Pseudoalteromonas spongiae TaxID=298657 RepID=UPI003736ECBA